jgi:hypothetical protein
VPVRAASLCATDVAVLDTGATVFLWMGKASASALCQQGFSLCAKFKVARSGGCETVVLSRGDTAGALRGAFWAVLGGSEVDIAPAHDGGKPPRREMALLRVSGGGDGGAPVAVEPIPRAAGEPPSVSLLPGPLAGGATALVDVGSDVWLYVPIGGAPDVAEAHRRAAVAYVDAHAPGAGFHVVKSNVVPSSFSDLFVDAHPPHSHNLSPCKPRGGDALAAAPRGGTPAALAAVLSSLAEWAPGAAHPKKDTVDVKVMRMRGNAVEEHPVELFGKFFAGDAYVVTHHYMVAASGRGGGGGGGATHTEVFFWLGRHSSALEQGHAAYTAVNEAAASRGGHAPQIRVRQGSEPPDFCAIWGDKMEVHAAGRSDGLPDPAWARAPHLFQIKGHKDFLGSTRACEVRALASSLFSGDVYVLVTEEPHWVFLWVSEQAAPFPSSHTLYAHTHTFAPFYSPPHPLPHSPPRARKPPFHPQRRRAAARPQRSARWAAHLLCACTLRCAASTRPLST